MRYPLAYEVPDGVCIPGLLGQHLLTPKSSQVPSIHINFDSRREHPQQQTQSASASEEDEDGVQVSPDEISPDYSVIHPTSHSSSSQHGDFVPVPLPYPSEVAESEPDAYPYQNQIAHRRIHRSRQRSESSRDSSIQPERPRRVVQPRATHHPRRREHPPEEDDTDSTEAFLQDERPEYPRMPRDQQYHGQSGYTHSSSSGSYTYPAVPHHHSYQMVHYAPPPAPHAIQHHPSSQMTSPYGYPPQLPQHQHPHPQPHPHPYAPPINVHHPQSQVTSPYSAPPYGPPQVMQQFQSPQSYFPAQYPPYGPQAYYMQQYQGMPPPLPPYMHYTPPPRESPRPEVASPAAALAPAEPKFDEQAMVTKFEALFLAERTERERREETRQQQIASAEDKAAALAKAEQEREEEKRRIRAEAIRQAEEEAVHYRKMLAERAEEEKRIRLEAMRAAEEDAIKQKKRDAERRAEEARIREEAKREALDAEKARIAAAAERAAYEQKIRKEAAEAALAAAAAEAKAKKEQADREKKIAADAAEAAKNAAEKEAKATQEAAEAAAKAAKVEHEAALKKAEEAAAAAKKEAEAAEAKAAAVAPPDKKAPLKFKDALGRNFNFPWDRCCKWDDMEGLIHQAFAHIEKIGPHVLQNHYDLLGPDKDIIMPEYWEDSITPGMQITMMLWPIPEPPPEPEPLPGDFIPPPPLDGEVIDIDALLSGVSGVKKSKSKDKGMLRAPPDVLS